MPGTGRNFIYKFAASVIFPIFVTLNLLNVVALQSKELGSGGGIGSGQRSCLIL